MAAIDHAVLAANLMEKWKLNISMRFPWYKLHVNHITSTCEGLLSSNDKK
jgi:hypothetical protein